MECWGECLLAGSPFYKGFSVYLGGVLVRTEQTVILLRADWQFPRWEHPVRSVLSDDIFFCLFGRLVFYSYLCKKEER